MLPLSSLLEKINPLDKNNGSSVEYYLSLLVNEKKVKSAIWSVAKNGEKDIVFGNPESWGNNNPEELIVAADASIASAVTKLASLEGKQPGKVILGIPENWVQENSIEQSKQDLFREVCKKMELKPAGFIVTPEAIAHFLKSEEGGLPSLILVNVGETEITVSLISKGKFLGSKLVGRSDNLALDLEEGLLRFDIQDNLPNRILLINDAENQNIEEARQTLVAYPWVGPEGEKKLKFLQLPKVEVADPNFEIKAVVLAGFREINPERAEEKVEVQAEKKVNEEPVFETTPEETLHEESESKHFEEQEEDFGFLKGEDILATGIYVPQKAEAGSGVEENGETVYTASEVPKEEMKRPEPIPKRKISFNFLPKFSLAFSWFKRIRLPRLRFDLKFGKLPLVVLFLPLLVLGFSLFGFWNWAKAEVKIIVEPQKIDKEFEFTISDEITAADSEGMVVPARTLSHQVSGSKTAQVTGKKTVGDKAKGEIIIYNRTEQAKRIPAGSILKGPGGLKFVIDEEVNVASKTADLAMGVDKWGEIKTTATAEDIGAQYNIASDSVLSFETVSSSSLLVKNPSAFSGGTSREIQAVSKTDRENLQKELLSELREVAKLEITNSLSEGDYLLEDSFELESKTDSFDREIDEEATSLSLEQEAEFSVLYIKQEDFLSLVEEVLSREVNEGYRRDSSSSNQTFSVVDPKKGVYKASVREKFLPEINTAGIPLLLKSKPLKSGEKIIGNINKVSGVKINISPKPFSYLKFFPFKEQNISVSIETLE
ncbi:hypothetical protein C4578_00660 [Candidatus Microgenomates bacterium]|jgi:hypothetical protein|nr:MAG: hypothetical protein C4578_00660 [Candidatus Microgenomates bacterium]